MRALLAIATLTLAGCVQADLDINGYFICNVDDDCSPSKVCRFNRCYDDPPPECSPYDSAGCAANERCAALDPIPICVTAGSQTLGESCEGDLDCGHGLTPVNIGDDCQCRELCRNDLECTWPETCSSTLVVRDTHEVWGPVPIGLCD
jgi:hypothetical protein